MKTSLLILLCLTVLAMGCGDDKKGAKKSLKASIPPLKKLTSTNSDKGSAASTTDSSSDAEDSTADVAQKGKDKAQSAGNSQSQSSQGDAMPTEVAMRQTMATQQAAMQGMLPPTSPFGMMTPMGTGFNQGMGYPYTQMTPWSNGMIDPRFGTIPGMGIGTAPGMFRSPMSSNYCPTCASGLVPYSALPY